MAAPSRASDCKRCPRTERPASRSGNPAQKVRLPICHAYSEPLQTLTGPHLTVNTHEMSIYPRCPSDPFRASPSLPASPSQSTECQGRRACLAFARWPLIAHPRIACLPSRCRSGHSGPLVDPAYPALPCLSPRVPTGACRSIPAERCESYPLHSPPFLPVHTKRVASRPLLSAHGVTIPSCLYESRPASTSRSAAPVPAEPITEQPGLCMLLRSFPALPRQPIPDKRSLAYTA